ncbi:MAG: dephospho-CoA kinase [Ruminococcus sp.]|nr:dephospho-CoA kinase [Ruminococcus sp.]
MSVIIGLTGQSGAGKTTICEQLKAAGFGIINCDEVARKCTTDGSDCNKELAQVFPACFDKNLSLDRKGISQIIFSDAQKLKQFNSIVYPYINRLIDDNINELSGTYDYIVLDAPTLFEAGADKKCDAIIGVSAKKEIRLERIIKRDNISRELALKRFNSQLSSKFFAQHCDYIIQNDSSRDNTEKETEIIIKKIKERTYGSKEKKT